MRLSILLADLDGHITGNDSYNLSTLWNQPYTLIRNGAVIQCTSPPPDIQIGDMYYKADDYLIVVVYHSVTLPKPIDARWGFYIQNILTMLSIPKSQSINMHITNMQNHFKDTQTVYSLHAVQKLLLEGLTNTYTNIHVI